MIFGVRVRLRAIEREDLSYFVQWINDPEVQSGLMISLPLSKAQEDDWFANCLKRPPAEYPLAIEVAEGGDWRIVGNCGYFDVDWRVHSGEVGILIGDKQYWNQGYGTEVMGLLVKHGFETLNLNRIYLQVYETNLRAIKCYEKSGFIHEGRKRQAMYKNGQYIDVLMMSVLRSEWNSQGI